MNALENLLVLIGWLIFLELQDRGANNINLVTGTPYIPHIIKALDMAKKKGLVIPIIYNSSGYESVLL